VQAVGGTAGFSHLSCHPLSPLRRQGASKELIVSNFLGRIMSWDIVADLLFVIEGSREKRRKVEEGTERNKTNWANAKVTEGRRRSEELGKRSKRWKKAAERRMKTGRWINGEWE
jgi:hypothetical protein